MLKRMLSIFALFIALQSSGCAHKKRNIVLNNNNPFFKKLHDEFAVKFGYDPLESYKISRGDFLIRAWVILHHQADSNGYFIQRINGEWSGQVLDRTTIYPKLKRLEPSRDNIYGPSETWDQVGQQLLRMDVLLLPDSTKFPKKNPNIAPFGGPILFVEVKAHRAYRNYLYDLGSAEKIHDFNDPFVVDAFLSAENITGILTRGLKPVETE